VRKKLVLERAAADVIEAQVRRDLGGTSASGTAALIHCSRAPCCVHFPGTLPRREISKSPNHGRPLHSFGARRLRCDDIRFEDDGWGLFQGHALNPIEAAIECHGPTNRVVIAAREHGPTLGQIHHRSPGPEYDGSVLRTGPLDRGIYFEYY